MARGISSFREANCIINRHTVSLVSRVTSFGCGGHTVKINTVLESSWSTKLKFVTFDLNRAQLDELEQVIDCAATSVNPLLDSRVLGQ